MRYVFKVRSRLLIEYWLDDFEYPALQDDGLICAVIISADLSQARNVAAACSRTLDEFESVGLTGMDSLSVGRRSLIIAGIQWEQKLRTPTPFFAARYLERMRKLVGTWSSEKVKLITPKELQQEEILKQLCHKAFELA